jgi:hypothetical protein
MRTRMYGGVAGEAGRPAPLCRFSCKSPSQSYLQVSPRASDAGVIRKNMNQIAAVLDGEDVQPTPR